MTTERPFHIDTRMFGGNAGRIRYEAEEPSTITFTCDPKGARPLWFHFRIKSRSQQQLCPENGKLQIILEHYDTLAGANQPSECCPVYKAEGQFWIRLPSAKTDRTPDGRLRAIWTISNPAASFEFALCHPYEQSDTNQLIKKSRGVWKQETIGLSSGGRDIRRLANTYESSTRVNSGLYIVARECGCDMPAGWILDGMLQRLLSVKHNPFITWAIPVADPDGARGGAWYSAPDIRSDWQASVPRHEVHVIQQDLLRWQTCTKPKLVLFLRAAELRETDGIYCEASDEQAGKWAHVIQHKLGSYAASDFTREPAGNTASAAPWISEELKIPALTICIPWSTAGGSPLSPKKYREAAKLIADAVVGKK